MRKIQKIIQKYWLVMLQIVIMILICGLYSYMSSGHYVNFFPINGTFQNFNPVRRLLDGQIPYRDFIDYLGIGHLYAGTIFTAVSGGDYQASLIAFTFLTIFCLAITSIIVCNAVTGKFNLSVCLTNFLLIILITQPDFFTYCLGLTSEMKGGLNYALGIGNNSARFVRAMIVPITIILCLGAIWIYETKIPECKIKKWLPALMGGTIAGAAFMWSNDYGISCWVCLLIVTAWIVISRSRSVVVTIVSIVIEIIASIISIFVFASIATCGHFGKWFEMTFGTGGYQSWYYNSAKSYYIFQVDFSYMLLIQLFIALGYAIMVFRNRASKESICRYGVLGFANLVCFCAVNEYQLLSGGGLREYAFTILYLTIIYEIINLIVKAVKNKTIVQYSVIASMLVSLAWISSNLMNEWIIANATTKNGDYMECLGGNMTALYDDLNLAHEFLDGDKIWSTYASAQEVVENTYQPSGVDYIIHVLGDEAREEYLEDFAEQDVRYVATIRKSYTEYEYWIERANWFFYRELYQNWHPVFANSYEMYWERNTDIDENTINGDYDVEVQVLNDSTVKLIINTDSSINGIADVYIDYSVEKDPDSKLASLQIQRNLKIMNTGVIEASEAFYESNYLRAVSAEYIPMYITDGYGELTLSSLPEESTVLNLNEVTCESIYTGNNPVFAANLSDDVWEAGINSTGNIVLFENKAHLLERLEQSHKLIVGDKEWEIVDITSDEQWIHVTVDETASECAFPAIIQLK